MEAESFLDTVKMSTTPQTYIQEVLLQELIFFVIQQMSLFPLIQCLSPPASLQLRSCSPVYQRVHMMQVRGNKSHTVRAHVTHSAVDSVCATDPAQHMWLHSTCSHSGCPSYGYPASRKPQNLPLQTGQAFRQEKGHVRKTQACGNHSHCRTFR